MKFKKLDIAGFKSFFDKTTFLIQEGLTGIVGPNGCGKSNIVEALRWCMGETSAKSMRGSGMEDVIFSGTSSRPPKNIAEVSVFLENSDKDAPLQYNDLDEVAALCQALDTCISVSTAVAAIAAGVGTPTKLLSWKQSPWNNLLLAPCGPFVDTYQRNSWETWDLSFNKLARDLKSSFPLNK